MDMNFAPDVTDGELVAMALDRDSRAYGELIRRWERAVISSAYHITSDVYTSEDIAQESFFACWFKLFMLKEHDKFGAWVCRVAKNHALNHVTRKRREYPLDVIMAVQSKGTSPERIYIESETRTLIRDAFASLSDKLREPAEMFYLRALSQKQIASELSLPEGTVKRRLFDARTKLKSELAKVGITNVSATFRNERKDSIMTREFINSIQEKIKKFSEYTNSWENWFFEKGDTKSQKLREITELQKAIDEMDDSDDKRDALMKAYYYQTYFDSSDEAFEKAYKMACERNDLEMIEELVIGSFRLWSSGSEKITVRTERMFSIITEENVGTKRYANILFWYAKSLADIGQKETAVEYFTKVMDMCGENNGLYAVAKAAVKGIETLKKYADDSSGYLVIQKNTCSMTLVNSGEKMILSEQPGYSWIETFPLGKTGVSALIHAADVICNAANDSWHFFADGMVAATNETVSTHIGTFENCTKTVKINDYYSAEFYYAPNVGIIKANFTATEKAFRQQFGDEAEFVNMDEYYELDEYKICSGEGLIPLAKGNEWKYKRTGVPETVIQHIEYAVEGTNGDASYLSTSICIAAKALTPSK